MRIRTALKRLGLTRSLLKQESTYLFLSDWLRPISFRKEQDRILQYTRLNRYRFDVFDELSAIRNLRRCSHQEAYESFMDDIYDCFYIPVKYKIKFADEWLHRFKSSS